MHDASEKWHQYIDDVESMNHTNPAHCRNTTVNGGQRERPKVSWNAVTNNQSDTCTQGNTITATD